MFECLLLCRQTHLKQDSLDTALSSFDTWWEIYFPWYCMQVPYMAIDQKRQKFNYSHIGFENIFDI